MAGRITAKNASVFVGGRTISGRTNSATLGFSAEAPEVTSFGEGTRTRLSGGLKDIEMTVDGFYDESASQMDELFNSLIGGSAYMGFYPSGSAASAKGREFGGAVTDYSTPLAVADAAAVSVTITTNAAGIGLIGATSLGGSATDTAASLALSSVDFSGSCSTAYGILRVFTVGGTTPQISACLQESNDDAAWTTIGLFTTASVGNTAEQVTLTSASRYRRAKYILAGTGPSATFHVSCGSVL